MINFFQMERLMLGGKVVAAKDIEKPMIWIILRLPPLLHGCNLFEFFYQLVSSISSHCINWIIKVFAYIEIVKICIYLNNLAMRFIRSLHLIRFANSKRLFMDWRSHHKHDFNKFNTVGDRYYFKRSSSNHCLGGTVFFNHHILATFVDGIVVVGFRQCSSMYY